MFAAHLSLASAHIDIAFSVVPGGNPVPPPELAGDTPVLDIAHPGEVHVFVLFGHELDTTVFYRFNSRLGQGLSIGKPLISQHRLDDQAGAITTGHAQHVVFNFLDQTCQFHVGNNLLAGRFPAQAGIGGRKGAVNLGILGAVRIEDFGDFTNVGVLRHDVDHGQVVAFAYGVVVEVVSGGDLHTAGAFFRIGVVVGHDGNAAVNQRQQHVLANQVLVAFIIRVHGHRCVTQHGFRAGGGDDDVVFAVLGFLAVGQRVAQVPEVALFFLVFDFQIRDGGVQLRIPVHQTFAAIYQAFVVQTDKHFLYGFVKAVVHGEAFVAPVHGVAQAAHLAGDGTAGVFFPVPDALDEFFPAQIVAGFVFFCSQFAFDDHLGGDAGMIGANGPQCVTALHALEAGEGVHDGVLERMAHVQAAGHVGWRDGDAVGIAFSAGAEIAFGFPVFVPLALDVFWLVGFFHGIMQ